MSRSRRRRVSPALFRPSLTQGATRKTAHPIAAWFGRGALRLAGLLPYRVHYELGAVVGRLIGRIDGRVFRHTEINLRLCFPEMADRDRAGLARRSLAESGRGIVELAALWTWSRDRVFRLVRELDGEPHLDAALVKGGIVLVGPHLGAWELVGLYCSSRFGQTSVYMPPFDPALDRFFVRGRTRFGGRLAPATLGGTRALLRALSRGESVGIMPDQDPGRGAGVFVPFFGVLARTTTLVARLAQRTGASVVLAYAERLPAGAGFRLHFRPASPEIHDPDVLVATAAMNRDIERLVLECPDQYLWSYKRFRIRPPGEASLYRADVSHVPR